MKEYLDSAKAFSIPYEAWYAGSSMKSIEPYPYLMIGFYYDGDGTEGEFKIVWDSIGIRLMAYDDSWEALSRMPELINLMAMIDRNDIKPSITEFVEFLKKMGYKDITERIPQN